MNGMSGESQRWQGQRSEYPWEQDALEYIKAQMPDAEPYRAWQTFTFTASSGHVREVDLFIATPGGLFLVEIKSHPGKASNNGPTWIFRDGTRTRTIENPLHFTDQKAKELRGQLERAAKQLNVREPVPRIEAAVFLSAENLRCDVNDFDDVQRLRVYGRDNLTSQTKLPGIWGGFLNRPPASEKNRVTVTLSKQLPKILHTAGIARLHKIGRVGPYELAPKSFDAGPTWEDYLARNPSLPNDYPRRVRVYLSEQYANEAERDSTRRAARREYLALQGISHDGIVRAEQYSDELLAGPAVVFRHGEGWQRLDQFMAAHGSVIELETRLEMIRQLAEALDHAHRRHLYHRALAARCVYVELDGRYPRLRIGDWQLAARPNGTNPTNPRPGTNSATGPVTALGGSAITHLERSAGAYLAPEFASPEAPPALLDVFGLGALSYLILTNQPPALSRELLGQRLQAEHALAPSSVADSTGPSMDALVRDATQIFPADRTQSVRQFLKGLDKIEEELTAPDMGPQVDPLTAVKGDEINGWTVERVLGKGSTSRALLVVKNASSRVFKVALSESAARRLTREAEQLGQLTDSHVARLLDPAFDAGPPESRRKVIGVEYVGDHTLADELRQHGPLTIHELERLGEDLFQALKFLDGRDVWHRDIKPDNLALRTLERKGRELVLFDFSLAGAPDTDLNLGTLDYLDPFLGTGRRDRYDQAAELYAVAVTLHEMASGELPSWGDDLVPSSLLDPGEEVQLAEDVFDPVLRDGLVEFFRIALHRDAKQRFGSLHAMTRAWTDIFRDLDTVPPLTTASTVDDDSEDAQVRRARAIQEATPGTALVAAGLSPYALSIAQQRLGVSTAGELARVPAKRITRLRGIGSVPRYELVRLSRQWRERFRLSEAEFSGAGFPTAENQDQDIVSERTGATPVDQAGSAADASPQEDLAHLSVDEVVRRLIPDSPPDLARVAGMAPAGGEGSALVHPWAVQREITQRTGMTEGEVAAHLNRLRARWAKSVPALTPVREDIVAVLADHGRILDWRQLAAGLLARRGSELGDSDKRLTLAAICVRAAVETEERRDKPRMVARRIGDRVLIALTGAQEEDLVPAADDLFAYAELLGEQADALAARDPLPGSTEIKQTLRDVDAADHATRLSDTDIVLLAAAASEKTAATARLELYPRDLSPERALKISQAGSFLGDASDAELARRVRARFPELTSPPTPEDIPRLLRNIGYDTKRGTDGLLHALSATYLSGRSGSTQARGVGRTSSQSGVEADSHAWLRLEEARRRGGFVAVKARINEATNACELIAAMERITAVNVTAEFVRILREITEAQGRPRWETVLRADSEAATPAAKVGFARLLDATWSRLDAHVRAIGSGGIVLLHDATPLARYTGGEAVLAKFTVAARQSGEQPHGLWLLCPMQNPKDPPHLDDRTVGVIPGDAEQLVVPDGFGASQRRAS